MKTTVVLLTWQRINTLRRMLSSLSAQTYKDFDVVISNGNQDMTELVEKQARVFSNRLRITVRHDSNEEYAFRRLYVGRDIAENGTDLVIFLDDDVSFSFSYIQNCINQYKPQTYQSYFAWKLLNSGKDYYKYRKRVFENNGTIHYCGTGVGMIDASIFLEDELFNKPEEAVLIEDLWLSYYAQHVMGWELKFMNQPGTKIGGNNDSAALWRSIVMKKRSNEISYDKADFLRKLIKEYGWKLKA